MLLSTLAAMGRLRRGVALLACIGVLGWTLLLATHWHDPAETGPSDRGGQHCVLCLAKPAGAAPPEVAGLRLPPPSLVAVALPAMVHPALAAPVPPYFVRGPPAS
jgi:hypothetical protein